MDEIKDMIVNRIDVVRGEEFSTVKCSWSTGKGFEGKIDEPVPSANQTGPEPKTLFDY